MSYTPRKRDMQLQRRYGIDGFTYELLLESQGGRCAICNALPLPKKALAVDHCHLTGHIRGLLCSTCNTALGAFRDSPKVLAAVLMYLLQDT